MDEYEQLQKFFIEKQKENLRLKQELTNLKEKLSDDNSDFSRISDKQKENKTSNYNKFLNIFYLYKKAEIYFILK